jgi:hypothetical protein
MQNEVPLTLTALRNDPEQMARLRTMVESFTWSHRKEQDIGNLNISPIEQGKM